MYKHYTHPPKALVPVKRAEPVQEAAVNKGPVPVKRAEPVQEAAVNKAPVPVKETAVTVKEDPDKAVQERKGAVR